MSEKELAGAGSGMPARSGARLTVVMPTYNRRMLLERAIESVLVQIRGDDRFLVHVWDNHSSDETESFMRDLIVRERNVQYTRRPENIGAIANYRDSIGRVETEFYVGLGDDDYLVGDFLPDALDRFEKDPSLAAVVMQTLHVNPAGEIVRVNPGSQWDYRRLEPAEMMDQWCRIGHMEWSSIVFRKEAYDAVGGLDLKYGLATDAAFQMNLFLRYPVLVVEKPAAVFNLHDQQQSSVHVQREITQQGFRHVEEILHLVSVMESHLGRMPQLREGIRVYRWRYAKSFSRAWRNGSARTLLYLVSKIACSFRMPGQAMLCILWWLISRLPLDFVRIWKKSRGGSSFGHISDHTHFHSFSRGGLREAYSGRERRRIESPGLAFLLRLWDFSSFSFDAQGAGASAPDPVRDFSAFRLADPPSGNREAL